MSYNMKLCERVIEHKLIKEMHILDNQFGFIPEKSTIETIYLL